MINSTVKILVIQMNSVVIIVRQHNTLVPKKSFQVGFVCAMNLGTISMSHLWYD